MLAVDKLRGIIAERGMTQKDVAAHLGMADMTFYRKMKKGVFGTDEVEKMIDLLQISDPVSVFLAKK